MLSNRSQNLSPPLRMASIPQVTLALFVLTGMFYIFESGQIQPGHMLLLAGFALSLLLVWQAVPREGALYLALGLFLSWIILVNGFWLMWTGEFQFLKKTSLYIYNSIVLIFVISFGCYDYERLRKTIWISCVVGLFIELLYIEMVPAETKRLAGTFNDPNQLGYWALLVMTCLLITTKDKRLGSVDVLAICAGMYAALLTLSKAAIISSTLLLALAVAGCGLRRQAGWLLGILFIAGLALQVSSGNLAERITSFAPVAAVVKDMSGMEEEGEEDIVKRGYRRLILYPEYLFLGAGEGDFARFGTGGRSRTGERDREFHSSLGNLLLSYGIVGLMLFLGLLAVILAGAPWTTVSYLLPIMLYGLSHNGLRFSLLWVFFGLVFAQGHYGAKSGPSRG